MRRITESERQRILELHRETPMKPFLFEQPSFNVGPGGVITRNQPFDPQRYTQDLSKKGVQFYEPSNKKQQPTISAIKGEMPKDLRGTKEFQAQLDKEEKEKTKWKPTHLQLELLAMASLLVPVIGPLLSIAIELQDIEMYVKEKDYYSAGLFTIFMAIPGMALVPPQIKEIVKKWTKDKIKNLAKKLKFGGVFDDGEKIVVDYLNKNTDDLKKGLDDLAKPKINQIIQDPSLMRAGNTIQLPTEVLQQIGKGGLKVLNFLAPLIYIPVAYDAAVKSGTYIAKLMDEQLHGESLLSKIEKLGLTGAKMRQIFFSSGSEQDEKKLYDILSDPRATYCGEWRESRPIQLKYQTEKYKNFLSKDVVNMLINKALEKPDCRFPGTYGRSLKGSDKDPYEYKFLDGKYSVKKKEEFDWIDVTDSNMIKAIEKLFTSNGLVKNQKLGIYEK